MPPISKIPKQVVQEKIFNNPTLSNTASSVPVIKKKKNIEKTKHDVPINRKSVVSYKQEHVSVPITDIHCFINTNNTTVIDSYTKQVVKYQIGKKMYAQPQKRVQMWVTAKKTADFSSFDVTTNHGKMFKVHKKHFKEKNMMVDDINFKYLQWPIRASTPTHSVCDSTILAGHLDTAIIDGLEEDAMNKTAADTNDNSDDEMLNKYINTFTSRPAVKVDMAAHKLPENKEKYCTDWMKKCDGVSTTNSDVAPSLYAPSVAMSDSLMNVTSVSRNVSPVAVSLNTKPNLFEKGRGINNLNTFKGMVFQRN